MNKCYKTFAQSITPKYGISIFFPLNAISNIKIYQLAKENEIDKSLRELHV